MIITNPNNLPDVLIKAAFGDQTRVANPERMSVTDLINPPLIRHLKLKHWNQLSEDIDDLAWSLFGKAFHDLMHKYSSPCAMSEYKIEHKFGPYTLVGQPDVHLDGILDDYKVTSVWSFIYGDKPEWEQQLNIYSWLLSTKNIQTNELRIIAILRDWVKTKIFTTNYPKSAFHVINLPMWTINDQVRFIGDRIKAHQNPVECTSDEKWQRETKYAVVVPGIKKAKRVLDTEQEAMEWINAQKKGNYEITMRLGETIRCNYYCPVRGFCEYAKKESTNEDDNTPS